MQRDSAIRRAGVIDIGSNSVRLVVYGVEGSSLVSLFDEKAMCGLGRGLSNTGTLYPPGRAAAVQELRRFARVAADEEPDALFPFATAAVRDASDRAEFIDQVAQCTGMQIEVISGHEEARLAAKGVAGAIPGATGIVGDLGGGSLELVSLQAGQVCEQVSLPVGALRLAAEAPVADAKAWVDAALDRVGWLRSCAGQPFYLVGGAWRAFARVHMRQESYPLEVIHHYAMTPDSACDLSNVLSLMSKSSADLLDMVSKKRREIMPYAATVLAQVIQHAEPSDIIASSHGLREGYMRDRYCGADGDPLLDFCRYSGGSSARIPPPGDVIYRWLTPLFADAPAHVQRLIEAACWLCDLAGREHPGRRAYIGYARALNLPSVALDHAARGFLAAAIRTRYSGGRPRDELMSEALHLTPKDQLNIAIRLGNVLRMAQAISPTGRGLTATTLTLSDSHVALSGPADLLAGETVSRRLGAVATAFGREPQLLPTS